MDCELEPILSLTENYEEERGGEAGLCALGSVQTHIEEPLPSPKEINYWGMISLVEECQWVIPDAVWAICQNPANPMKEYP